MPQQTPQDQPANPDSPGIRAQRKIEASEFDRDIARRFGDARAAKAINFARQFQDAPKTAAEAPTSGPVEKVEQFYANRQGDSAVADAGLSVGRDVSLGILQSPRSALRGVAKGVNSMIHFVNEISDWTPAALETEAMKIADPDLKLPVPVAPAVPTVTGGLIEGVAQFATGLKGVDKLAKGLQMIGGFEKTAEATVKASSVLKDIAKASGKGSLADLLAFDEHEQRLSNIIEQVPDLKNPVTEYLQASPDDNFAEAKLKQAVEGTIVGAAGETLFKGIGFLKKGLTARDELKATGKSLDEAIDLAQQENSAGGLTARDFQFLGDPAADRVVPKSKIEISEVEVEGAFGKVKQIDDKPAQGIDDYEINFARIDGPDDIKTLMDEMVNRPELKISIEAARRGERSNAETLTAAQDIDGFQGLMDRRTGDAFNAEQIVAARKVYYDTTAKLMQAAKQAAGPRGSEVDLFNFRKMIAVHHAVQKEFMGVRAEAGRALQAWRIPVGEATGENARILSDTLREFGGVDGSKDLAMRIANMGENLNTDQINAIVQGSAGARTMDAISEAWTLGLLTNPTTHVVNLSSNVLTSLQLGVERMAAAGIDDSPVTFREGVSFFQGLMESQRMAIANAAQTFKTGESNFSGSKIELRRDRATSSEILDPDGKAGILSKAMDYYGGLLSKYVGGALTSADEYNKTLLYQAQLRALATREGISRGLDPLQLRQYVADSLTAPTAGLRADAITFASYGTFTRELGKGGKAVQNFIAAHPAARFVAPFVRTPANIFKFGFERTPLALVNSKIRADINAGGVRRASALAKIGTGTTMMAIGSDMALNGHITGAGPADPDARSALKRTGWQPYSIKLGDTYYSYSRFEPVATLLGLSADLSEILSNYDAYDLPAQDEADELVTASIMAMGNQVVGKTFMQGFADMTQALSDPKRYGEQLLNKYAGSFVPAGVAAIARASDPELKQVFGMVDAIKSRLPGFSKDVPPRRNIWGEPIQYFAPGGENLAEATAERVLSLFNPVYYSAAKNSPVDDFMLKNGFRISMPNKTMDFDGVSIDLRNYPKAYDRLVELRGNGLRLQKYGNQTMKGFFASLAEEQDPFGRHLGFFMKIGNDYEAQQSFINSVVSGYQAGAKEQLLTEFPEIGAEINQNKVKATRLNRVRPSLRELQKGIQ